MDKGQENIMSLLESFTKKNYDMGSNLTEQISCLRDEVTDALNVLMSDLKTSQSWSSGANGERLIRQECASTLQRCQTAGLDIAASLGLLSELRFEEMKFRHAKISEVHPTTYDWIFEEKFQSWVRSADPIFWVSGKPGSGKSTLMKYIVDSNRTARLLEDWSGVHKLVIAKYFFWINGVALQRSQEGLLRTLLYDILHQCPELIRHALPDIFRVATISLSNSRAWSYLTWTREELLQAFQRLNTVGKLDTRFCFFIDGLDEYEGHHDDLIRTIRSLTKIGVKLCIASRPWNVFEEAFGFHKKRKIYMQDLNKPDMQRFVDDRLRGHKNFSKVVGTHADEIVSEIVEKSQGVFLWVHLVVRSLLEGLRNMDTVKLLRKRLRAFPSDLDLFFRHMFLSLDPTYRTHLSHMFQIALAARRPLSPFAYWFSDKFEENPNMALSMPIQVGNSKDTAEKIREVAIRINGRCRGLMEVSCASVTNRTEEKTSEELFYTDADVHASVDFLHRTVKDFLMVSEIQALLRDWQEPDFQPSLTLCKMSLAELKFLALMPRTCNRPDALTPVVEEFFYSAQQYEERAEESPIAYVDKLGQALAVQLDSRAAKSRPNKFKLWESCSTLELAAAYNLKLYVSTKMNKRSVTDDQRSSLIKALLQKDAVWFLSDRAGKTVSTHTTFGMIAIIAKSLSSSRKAATLLEPLGDRMSKLDHNTFDGNIAILLDNSVIEPSAVEKLKAKRRHPSAPPYRALDFSPTASLASVDATQPVESTLHHESDSSLEESANEVVTVARERKSIRARFKRFVLKLC
ncbi:hypothetical protein N0V94_008060 [Neodidymelliopsis sp. IMI 364377]|nr:hypothetical protein N0V94_008060 [Neodidymelliopsis sp. IMI 364377]